MISTRDFFKCCDLHITALTHVHAAARGRVCIAGFVRLIYSYIDLNTIAGIIQFYSINQLLYFCIVYVA